MIIREWYRVANCRTSVKELVMTDPEATQQDTEVDVKPSADKPPPKQADYLEPAEETVTADYQTRARQFDEDMDQSG